MRNILRNVLAVLVGLALCGSVNMALITISPMLVPPPAGVDVTNPESLTNGIHLFEFCHFMMPFLAHVLGTLVGAFSAYLIAGSHKSVMGGVIGAYIPMAWLGIWIGSRTQKGDAGRESWK